MQTPSRPCSCLLLLTVLCPALLSAAEFEPTYLEYVGRYKTQSTYHDHLMGVEQVGDHHALVCSNLDIVIVDLSTLPMEGTQAYVDRLPGLDVTTTVTRSDGYVYANLRMGGLAVVYFDENALSLSLIGTREEPGIYYEKMSIVDDLLYVAAHAYGMRIYDLSNPANPVLVGSLNEGLEDAFAVAVQGTDAYIADGAGGLKIVDVTDESNPQLIAGETPATAAGTAEDVKVIGNYVYVACGGSGVAVYGLDDLATRVLYNTPVCAKHLAVVGSYLAVADIGGVELFALEAGGVLTHVAGEAGQRRSLGGSDVTLRLWHGVDGWGDDRLLTADWDSMDVYRLENPALGDQPDATLSTHRLRFAPQGGSDVVWLRNDGAADLQVLNISVSESTFGVQPTSGLLEPGESLEIDVTYVGGQPGSAMIIIETNDPDENPLPIQVYGETSFLDPGESAIPFTLESWIFDHTADEFVHGTFDLAMHAGKIVYFHVFGLG